ncbi:acyl-CoAN-acyltransferase [Moniliophthora roreri MCA 2997]|uniref:Acyl-CoAN-acyltransferase n=1 Tax=Moniliophthora roreri (strain MCA 2997) TaxID=1381753 RepID=V2WVX6_MONRO|nr:acyl-CoAN-acyltransferase [Moniliophthora roreri MCA 2997]
MNTRDLVFDLVSASELADAIAIEEEGYPVDEAASLSSFQLRQSQAGEFFLGAFLPNAPGSRRIIGYICSTLADGNTLTHESMSKHVPGSTSVCIHSVCVSSSHRREGIALRLLKEYLTRLKDMGRYERVLLIAHEELISLYQKAGFELVGKSSVQHGSRPWFEMCYVLPSDSTRNDNPKQEPAILPSQLSSNVWEVLSASRPKVEPKLFTSFSNGMNELVEEGSSGMTNKTDLMCPRCGSVILLRGVGSLKERSSVELNIGTETHSLLPPLPPPSEKVSWWLTTPSPMKFENIGFSRTVQANPLPSGKKMKLLACAECDLGPLGWCEEAGTEFWLAPGRVGYRL